MRRNGLETIERYHEKNGTGQFEIVEMQKTTAEARLRSALLGGRTEDLPDVVLIEDYNAPALLEPFAKYFVPLTDQLNYNNFAKYKTALVTHNGERYGVPFDAGVTGLYYRTDVLSKIGLPAKAMDNLTWDEYIELGKKSKPKPD